MPHFIVEYTDNLEKETDIRPLLEKANTILINQNGLFPIAGIRSRAIKLDNYVIADGEEDYAFVHASLTVAAGRSEDDLQRVAEELFDMITDHFEEAIKDRYLALSLELNEFTRPTLKKSNIHARFQK
ncbi:5-carboxymethyl-2-hydroxymuconate isomerase [Desulfomarina profundi]|uniref:5-carboxymethyl-2-hydroxymuconate isomerase n=1 Tax=Desulfomarina profundi TaxID=2772557 RepID=A0A8D5FK44_9BACT|nr:5-carboxymethyl-2-hydroxymuconate Delta-isomerase [Desulfomarina profundi]BCL62056.1 5-carboxymethyl-2-hydroxymuconate isomerase [Desulfomarina profundi]